MFAVRLTAEWAAWITALAQPLHRRLAGRLAQVAVGILLASGRRTAKPADERRDKRASHLLPELPGRVHARPTRTRGAAHRGGRLQAQMCHLGLKEVLSGR